MKKLLMNVALAVAVCAMAAGCASAPKIPLVKNDRIVFLGDSITAAGVWPGGYVKLTADKLTELYPDLKITVIGAGISAHKVPGRQLAGQISRFSLRKWRVSRYSMMGVLGANRRNGENGYCLPRQ